jgi:hypothetical protein
MVDLPCKQPDRSGKARQVVLHFLNVAGDCTESNHLFEEFSAGGTKMGEVAG